MNTLEDLRRDLAAHAGEIIDHELGARPAAVRHRVAVVRRRRRTAVAGAALAAIVAGGSLTTVLRQPDRGPEVLGQRAPLTQTSLGYTYRATGAVSTFTDRGVVRLPASDSPRLLSWTTDQQTAVHLSTPGGDRLDSRIGHFGDFFYVSPGSATRVRVNVDAGRVGVAEYDLTDRAPDGVTRDGITYRQSVAGTPLLGAAIGELGASEVTVSFVAPGGQVRLSELCDGVPAHAWIHVSFNGHDRVSGSCREGSTFDPAAGSYSSFPMAAGRHVEVRAYVSRTAKGDEPLPASELAHARVGVGIYGPMATTRVGGFKLPTGDEYAGHTWQLVEQRDATSRRVTLPTASNRPQLLSIGFHSPGDRAGFEVAIDGRVTQTPGFGAGAGATSGIWIPAGTHSVRVTMTRGGGHFGVALYALAD